MKLREIKLPLVRAGEKVRGVPMKTVELEHSEDEGSVCGEREGEKRREPVNTISSPEIWR